MVYYLLQLKGITCYQDCSTSEMDDGRKKSYAQRSPMMPFNLNIVYHLRVRYTSLFVD